MKKGAPGENDYEYSASWGMGRSRRKLLLALMGGLHELVALPLHEPELEVQQLRGHAQGGGGGGAR